LDKHILGPIAKWLKVGVVEDGRRTRMWRSAPQNPDRKSVANTIHFLLSAPLALEPQQGMPIGMFPVPVVEPRILANEVNQVTTMSVIPEHRDGVITNRLSSGCSNIFEIEKLLQARRVR
jgi:hypothetical protein